MCLLRQTSRWIFFAALAYAPWAYGGTTSTSITVINWLLGAALLLWVIDLLINRRWPRFPKVLIALVVALLAAGGWMVFNAFAFYDSDFRAFAPIANLAPHLPGSADYAVSAAWMIRAALLLMSILFVVDLTQDNRALLQFWYAIGVVVGSISLLGLLQKATGASMIFWQPPLKHGTSSFFSAYYYHANAGAFLNLGLPLTAGLALRTFSRPSSQGSRALWSSVFVLNLAAIASNTSRMAQLVGGLSLLALAIPLGPLMVRGLSRGERNVALAGTAAILFALFAIGKASHLERPLQRWQTLSEHIPQDARWLASQVAVDALPGIGIFGFGPGSFRIVFPVFNNMSPHRAPGRWRFLHEDYLQTLMEWGWVGSALWGLLFFGGMAVAVRNLRRQRRFRRSEEGRKQRSEVPPTPGYGAASRGQTSEDTGVESREQGERRSDVRRQTSEDTGVESRESGARRSDIPPTRGYSENLREQGGAASSGPTAASQPWSPRRRLILPLVVIALIGVALHALVDFPLQIYSIQLYAATYVGLCWGAPTWR